MSKYNTPNGKEIEVYRCPQSAQWKIKFTSGGELPEELSGIFTNGTFAETAINKYLEKQETKKTKAEAKEE
jgi:hypothetical protein